MRIKEITEDTQFIPQIPPRFGNTNYQERGGEIIVTTPQKYLAACPRLDVDVGSQNKIDQLKMKIKAGEPIDPPALFLKNERVVRHDGRHRAVAAMQLGIDHIPAIIVPLEGELTTHVQSQKTGKPVQL